MFTQLLQKFARDRRGATAVLIALMTVPLIICCGAAVDFSRVASARAQLQAATDAAALAGVGAYQTNADGTAAYNVAHTGFAAASATLMSYATITSSSIGTACAGSAAQCGTTSANSVAASNCPAAYDYCVQVKASVRLQNSLIAHWIPTDVLSATSTATTNFPYKNTVNQGNFTHTSLGRGSDWTGYYAYVVPEDSAGHPEYGNVPPPNTNCNSTSYGPVYYEPNKGAPANGVTGCNYLLIGESTGGSGTGSLTFDDTNPIAFTTVEFDGGTITSGTADLDDTNYDSTTLASTIGTSPTHYTNELYVNGAYYANGNNVCSNAPASCSNPSVALYGTCPAHTLYGSITAYPNVNNNIVPLQDSINSYSSAYEYLGYPPTHGVNRLLLPFLGPVSQFTQKGASTTSTTSYYAVQAVCPQWPTAGTNIAATATINPGSLNSAYSTYPTETVAAYSTYFPDATYADTVSTNVYPPAINGCTPIISATAALPNASTSHPWWGWSPSNGAAYDPAETGVHNCSFNKVSVAGTMTTINQPSHMQATPFTAKYNNCGLLIQPLGTGISSPPDYYTYTANPSATAGTVGNAANIISMNPVYDNGAFPGGFSNSGTTGIAITNNNNGTFTVTEPSAGNSDNSPPVDTSHQCYNPQNNGIDGNTLPASDQPNNDPSPALPVDAVERPDLGVIYCNQNPPESYAAYWNDMGSWAQPSLYNDDIGYWNVISQFTCPTPAINTSGGSGPASLSG